MASIFGVGGGLKNKWNIGFEWVVTSIALISVVFLFSQAEQAGHQSSPTPSFSQNAR